MKALSKSMSTSSSYLVQILRTPRSEEMRPEWFSLPSSSVLEAVEGNTPTQYHSIPFSQMWETDYIWLPLVIRKQKFVGRADFRMSGDRLVPYKWWYALAPNDP